MLFIWNRVGLLLCFCVLGLGLLFLYSSSFGAAADVTAVEAMVICHFEVDEPQVERVEDIIAAKSTLQEALLDLGVTAGEIHYLVQDVRPVYDLNRVMPGHQLVIERLVDGTFHGLEYHIDDEEYLLVRRESDRYVPSLHKHDFEVTIEEFYGELYSSLWETLVSQGETPQLVQALHQILQWDIDFTRIRPKDSFKLILEKKYLNGEFVKYGQILAAQFASRGQTFYAFLYETPNGEGYYHENGAGVRKPFLKAPFDFDRRITSSFSHSRYHPILKERRPHLGVDYGAPRGTPVLASADGTVIFAGRQGGYGNLIRIRHPNGYTTGYAHLSRREVRTGQRVTQGERIGRVGSTGLSTAPHLDYRVQDRSGRFINPKELSALPSDKGVEKEYWNHFVSFRNGLMERLVSIPEIEPFLSRTSQTD
jgi:murein DD-endopeptidase MepM/ murein hydrolase activator NlpD